MEGHEEPSSPSAAVLNNRDLVGAILLRLAFPTDLVRAAAACKLWLGVASDPVFLRRFGDLHPPRLLGFYVNAYYWLANCCRPEFWPVRHPPELASAVRHAASVVDDHLPIPDGVSGIIKDCRGGRLLAGHYSHAVLNLAGCNGAIIPPAPEIPLGRPRMSRHRKILPERGTDDDDDDGLPRCFDLEVVYRHGEPHRTVQVNEFRHGVWSVRARLKTELLRSAVIHRVLVVGHKFYMATRQNILVLDLSTSSFTAIDFPEAIDHGFHGGGLSKADESGVYMINVVAYSELHIWLHRTGNWVLVDTVSVRELRVRLGISVPYGDLKVSCVGDNGEFVLLEMYGNAFYVDIPNRAMEAVLKVTKIDYYYGDYDRGAAWPFMTIWPPSFPKVMQGNDHDESSRALLLCGLSCFFIKKNWSPYVIMCIQLMLFFLVE